MQLSRGVRRQLQLVAPVQHSEEKRELFKATFAEITKAPDSGSRMQSRDADDPMAGGKAQSGGVRTRPV